MLLNELRPKKGAVKKRKRVGRGPGSGHGKTSTRGHKGQKARTGGNIQPSFEGGQMPITRRVPKRGFVNIFKKYNKVVNVGQLNIFEPNTIVDLEALKKKGLIKNRDNLVKILAKGELKKALTIKVRLLSQAARQKIEKAGGKIEVI